MSTAQQPDHHRSVQLRRTSLGRYAATNARGGTLELGTGEDAAFTPVEALLAAIGGCTMVDVDHLTSRRVEPVRFSVEVGGDKVKVDGEARLEGLTVTWDVTFPDGPAGDEARRVLPDAIRRSHDRLCTVGRTVEVGTPVANIVSGEEPRRERVRPDAE